MLSFLASMIMSSAFAAQPGCLSSIDTNGAAADVCVGSTVGAKFQYEYGYWIGEVQQVEIKSPGYGYVMAKAISGGNVQKGQLVDAFVRVDENGTILDSKELSATSAGCAGTACVGNLVIVPHLGEAREVGAIFGNDQIRLERRDSSGSGFMADRRWVEERTVSISQEKLKVGETVMVMPVAGSIGSGTITAVTPQGYRVTTTALMNGGSRSCDGGGLFRDNSGFDFSERLNDKFKYKNDSGMFCTMQLYRETTSIVVEPSRVSKRTKCLDGRLCRGSWITFSTTALSVSADQAHVVKGWIQYIAENGLVVVRYIQNGDIAESATTVKLLRAAGVQNL